MEAARIYKWEVENWPCAAWQTYASYETAPK